MIGYCNEYLKILKLPLNEIINEYKIIQIGSRLVEVINFIKILSYGTEMITLKVKDNEINIEGSNLEIKELDRKDIIIAGNINKIFLSRV